MDKRIKAKWIKALRSGEYRQTREKLRKSGAFCCLGVLCNLHAQEHPEIAVNEKDRGAYLGETSYLPQAVWEWSGLKDPSGIYRRGWVTCSLAEDNDTGMRFPAIADVIEKYL